MRTFSSLSTASKPSMSTSSSSSSTSLSRRWPPGRTLVDSSSVGRGPWDGLGLMVSREEPEPASRMPGLGAGTAGFTGRGFGVGSGGIACGRGFDVVSLGSGLGAAASRAGVGADLAASLRSLAGVRLVTLDAGPRTAARARDSLPRARDGFFAGLLEELTPELSDLTDWVGRRPQSYDRGLGRHLGHALGRRVRDAFGVDPDHPVVNPALLNDQGPDRRVAFQTAGRRDLE